MSAIRVGTKTPLTRTTESAEAAEAAEFAEEGTQANARAAGHRNVLVFNARSALPNACVYRSVGSALSAVRAAMPWVRCGVPDKWGFRGGQIFVVDRPLRYLRYAGVIESIQPSERFHAKLLRAMSRKAFSASPPAAVARPVRNRGSATAIATGKLPPVPSVLTRMMAAAIIANAIVMRPAIISTLAYTVSDR